MQQCDGKRNCACFTCAQLDSIEQDVPMHTFNDNFILHPSKYCDDIPKQYTYFGAKDFVNSSEEIIQAIVREKKFTFPENDSDTEDAIGRKNHSDVTKFKSVVYLCDNKCGENDHENCVTIDDEMSLDSNSDTNVIQVIFKNSFPYANSLIDDIMTCEKYFSDEDCVDDLPVGIEAFIYVKHYHKRQERLSSNSRNDAAYPPVDNLPTDQTLNNNKENKFLLRVNTPANLPQSKQQFSTSSAQDQPQNSNERMVSPKGRIEHFPHMYVANNVKTSTFNEQTEKSNLSSAKNSSMNNTEFNNKYNCSHNAVNMVPERDTGPNKNCVSNFTTLGRLQIPDSGQNKLNDNGSGTDERRKLASRPHHHVSVHELRIQHRTQHCNSSSDENRSSGHASMSDTGNSSPRGVATTNERLTAGVLQKGPRNRTTSQHSRSRYRATPAKLQVPWTGNGGLEDIKMALQQLTMRSHTSTSTYSSVSAGSESSEPVIRRLIRHSSLETINTNITNADEFVWVDSHNRLVELQHLPWNNHCLLRVLQTGRCRESISRVSIETIPRLSYLLQRALVRLGRETQRLSSNLGICTKHDITVSFRIVLCPPLADSCIKACQRAAAMLAMSGDGALKQNKSLRAGLQLHVGRFHRWMMDVKLGRFIHEYAAVYLCAGIENLLEEILLQCLPSDSKTTLTATLLEHAIANNGDLWGLLQPYAHLNAGRIASGALALPRWASESSVNSGKDSGRGSGPIEPSIMTTCVGSLTELQDLLSRMQCRIPLCSQAVRALFYFMRCSQLEHGEQTGNAVQELCYERAYVVLPPLVEWIRVATAHGEHRFAAILDKDDIMQAARLLLPGVDCPVRTLGEEALRVKKNNGSGDDEIEASKQIQIELAFRLMMTGRHELIRQALSLLPCETRLDTLNLQGHTALMLAALYNDDTTLLALLDAGASVDTETPVGGCPNFAAVNGETQHWTALTYATAKGHILCARLLLERGANVEGGARLSEDKCTLTPLQVACGSGNADMVSLLLAHGANPFLSTQVKDSLCYSASMQKGTYCAISVAAAHGQRAILQKLVNQPVIPAFQEVLSLEEMLAEGAKESCSSSSSVVSQFTKAQIKALQESMYHSAENNHLDITVEIRSLGIPWTLHCWMHSLGAAHEARLDCVIDQLLQDFLQVFPDDYSQQFVQECLPLLFNIFRYSKKESTTLLLADIFSTCFGWEPIKPIRDCVTSGNNSSRIDPKYVNNPELSDVTFRVEGRIFYAHKIVLVTASPRLRAMLSSKLCEGGTPTVQINDVRYHIFQIVMQFLYQGGCKDLEPAQEDILELMAAANFFQLDGLLRYCEARCAAMLALDNVVFMYIHAKVYNAMQLLEYCQGFLLQNMVALLTYDDSVKRLLFAKKLPNHDVLGGLLNTLQNRIKTRRSQGNTKFTSTNVQKPNIGGSK
ncbi:ankyrin repeat and BTB/POZ domain-containing protein 2 [Agrilus planipennis]|uniref:Ankyrin repeat and BTB/POZ domain-containing protein 2 n=1 Tax=Agrilus planipennis TaxID=224129 RepID=A0A1W4X320_AGRPL|nr:ankyrin repeat and BTB/POZ domain-containing protein 2 [Agrilus planipennis]